jgi:hypothetical protein
MATTVTIGSNQSISANTTSGTSGSGPYVITFTSSVDSKVVVGDIYVISDEASHFSQHTYLVTVISGSNYTLKQVDDGGAGMGDMTPHGNFYTMNDETFEMEQAPGTFKRAFADIGDFEVHVNLASPKYFGSSDDVIGQMHADSTFTDARTYFDNSRSLSSVTLSAADGQRHGGTDGAGTSQVVIEPTANAGHNNGIIDINIDNFIIEFVDINLDSLDSRNTNKAIVLRGTNDDNIIRNNMIHDKNGNPGSDGPHIIHTAGAGGSSDTISILNNFIYNLEETNNDSVSAINVNAWSGTSNIYNNTIYNLTCAGSSKASTGIVFGNPSSAVANVKNNIVALLTVVGTSTLARAYAKWTSGSTANTANNLSDDTTHATYDAANMKQSLSDSSALIGKTISEIDFESSAVANETQRDAVDLRIGSDSVCVGAGVDLGSTNGVNIDIAGTTRSGDWSIGAFHVAAASDTGSSAFLMFVT